MMMLPGGKFFFSDHKPEKHDKTPENKASMQKLIIIKLWLTINQSANLKLYRYTILINKKEKKKKESITNIWNGFKFRERAEDARSELFIPGDPRDRLGNRQEAENSSFNYGLIHLDFSIKGHFSFPARNFNSPNAITLEPMSASESLKLRERLQIPPFFSSSY